MICKSLACAPQPVGSGVVRCTADGLSSTEDDGFRDSFMDVYSASSLRDIPWHAVCALDPLRTLPRRRPVRHLRALIVCESASAKHCHWCSAVTSHSKSCSLLVHAFAARLKRAFSLFRHAPILQAYYCSLGLERSVCVSIGPSWAIPSWAGICELIHVQSL